MKIYSLIFLAISFLFSCNETSKKESNNVNEVTENHDHLHPNTDSSDITKELMAIHDSIMPAMGKLMNLKRKVTDEIKTTDSLMAIKSSDVLKKRKEEALNLNMQLEKADHEMMNWMHQYKADTIAKLDKEKAEAYIADQKQKIETVKDLMQKSISDAQFFIQKK